MNECEFYQERNERPGQIYKFSPLNFQNYLKAAEIKFRSESTRTKKILGFLDSLAYLRKFFRYASTLIRSCSLSRLTAHFTYLFIYITLFCCFFFPKNNFARHHV